MKSKFCLDCEGLAPEEQAAFCEALDGLAECDLPLLLELLFVSAEEIRALNREQRNVDRVTDVLSFPAMELAKGEPILSDGHGECIDTEDGEDRLFLGSVVICTERAKEQAEEYGHSYERELYYLAVHGVLHCLGYDHETEEERREMREKEESVMQKLGLNRV